MSFISPQLRYYRKKRDRFYAAGLTSQGKVRRRVVLEKRLRPVAARQRAVRSWRRRAARFMAAGLTTRGTVPQYRRWTNLEHLNGPARARVRDVLAYAQRTAAPVSSLERAWQEFRATIAVADERGRE
jgi:hypothetical protein